MSEVTGVLRAIGAPPLKSGFAGCLAGRVPGRGAIRVPASSRDVLILPLIARAGPVALHFLPEVSGLLRLDSDGAGVLGAEVLAFLERHCCRIIIAALSAPWHFLRYLYP